MCVCFHFASASSFIYLFLLFPFFIAFIVLRFVFFSFLVHYFDNICDRFLLHPFYDGIINKAAIFDPPWAGEDRDFCRELRSPKVMCYFLLYEKGRWLGH
jgi:hypothetical protein